MQVRPVIALVAATTLMTGIGVSAAAPKPKPKPIKPVCNLVVDEANDTFLLRTQDGVQPGPQEDALDLVSADIASDAKKFTAVIRVKKLSKEIATGRGQSYELQFLTNGTENKLYLSATILAGTESFNVGFRDATANTATPLGDATGVFDLAKNEIRITAPVSTFSGQGDGAKPGTLLTIGTLTASRNLVAVNVFADVNDAGATYKAGNPSCVKPGK